MLECDRIHERLNTVERPLNVPQFKVFPHLMFNFIDPKSIILVLNFLRLKFSSVECSNPLLAQETLNGGFTIAVSTPGSDCADNEFHSDRLVACN
jgi:hypothetical protein